MSFINHIKIYCQKYLNPLANDYCENLNSKSEVRNILKRKLLKSYIFKKSLKEKKQIRLNNRWKQYPYLLFELNRPKVVIKVKI